MDLFCSPLDGAVTLGVLGVLFVNGWTDAPNAIASAIGSGALSHRRGVILATVMNLLGGGASLFLGRQVARTVQGLGEFPPGDNGTLALAVALVTVILWAVAAWYFGLPTSESHGLMAALAGSALALGGGLGIRALWKVLIGLVFSVGLGFLCGWALSAAFQHQKSRPGLWRRGQQLAAALMAFAHGLQDTPKFAALLFMDPAGGLPLWGLFLCSGIMGLGTLLGGGRIIQKVGSQMATLTPKEGFAADLAGGISLVLSTLQGLPVSTTHAKTCAMMGAAMGAPGSRVDKKVVGALFAAWGLTFPLCGLGAFFLTKLVLAIPF